MVWKVLIADDEPIIREGIREAVDWEALNMSVVDEAEDGEEALEKALVHRADVLLVDLNMPIMNGLALIREAKRELPECRFVIVTGHDEFDYARQAIRFGVDEYLLKPANPVQLKETLRRVGDGLAQARAQEKRLELASRQISRNIPLLRERFCNEWIGDALSRQEVLDQLGFLKLPEREPSLLGVVRWPEAELGQSIRSERDRQLLLFAIENIAEELASPHPLALFRDPLGFLCAVLWDTEDTGLFAAVERAVLHYLKLHVVALGERIEGGVEGVPAAYRKARGGVYKESSVSPLVRRARQHLRDHYDDAGLSLEGTARAIGVSPVYLSRLFKQEIGMTFVALLTQIRIAKAIQLLSTTGRSIADIAETVGYESQHYFSTAFKKAVGVSPIRYRKGESAADD